MKPLYWLFGLCAVPQVMGAAVIREAEQVQVLPPSQDPWYTAPHGYEAKKPGSILRIRPAPGNLTTVVHNTTGAFNILYSTTDSRDRASWAVTTLFLPPSFYFSPSGKASLLSYQFAYNSANIDSAPSIGLYWRLAQENEHIGLKSDTSFISAMLVRGWIVNVPDHAGPDAAFGAHRNAGHATIDALRAILSLTDIVGNIKFNTVLWGYSGGSAATLAAAELQPKYAPDIKFAGVALGGLADDLSADLDNINESPIAGTVLAFLLGVTAQYPDATAYLENALVEETKDKVLSIRDINASDAVVYFAYQDVFTYFKEGRKAIDAPILQKLFKQQTNLQGWGTPKTRMFFYKAIGDQYCPIDQTDKTVQGFCNAGVDFTFERNTVGDHVSEIENGKPRAFAFVTSIFKETNRDQGCQIRDVTVVVDE
jgi:hypothetical protein